MAYTRPDRPYRLFGYGILGRTGIVLLSVEIGRLELTLNSRIDADALSFDTNAVMAFSLATLTAGESESCR